MEEQKEKVAVLGGRGIGTAMAMALAESCQMQNTMETWGLTGSDSDIRRAAARVRCMPGHRHPVMRDTKKDVSTAERKKKRKEKKQARKKQKKGKK